MEVRPGYKQTEVGIIPEDWTSTAITQSSEMTTVGFVGSMSHLFTPTGVPVLRGQDVLPNRLDPTETKFISPETHKVWKKSALQACDVVMVRVGVGAGTACVIPPSLGEANAASLVVIRPSISKLDANFLSRVINSDFGKRQVNSLLVGGAQPVINTATVAAFRFPLPPISEQHAIAAVFNDVDALLDGLTRLIAKKRDLKQATMQQLLTGQTRLPGFSGGWEVKRLGDIARIQKGQLVTARTLVPGNIPVIAGGKQPAYFHATANRQGKTITVSASGASAGFLAFHSSPIFASDCSTIGESAAYCIEFLFYALLLRQDEIYAAQTGGAQPHVQPKDLAPMSIGLPVDLHEQTEIAAVLSDMDAELAALDARLTKTRALKQAMMSELLTGKTRLPI